jgi:hypothetical protein
MVNLPADVTLDLPNKQQEWLPFAGNAPKVAEIE